jgi:hypothetical protein
MIKAIGWNGKLVIVGLSRGNCEKLLEGKPIMLAPETLPGLRQHVLVVGGETEQAITKSLESLLPPGALSAPSPRPGEEVRVTAEGVERVAAPDPDDVARRAAAEQDAAAVPAAACRAMARFWTQLAEEKERKGGALA